MINPQLDGKVVLVTGANNPQGIGAEIARRFAQQGSKVFITYMVIPLDDEMASTPTDIPGMEMYAQGRAHNADAVLEEIRGSGGMVEAWEADLSDPAVPGNLFDRVESIFGHVDILVNNAAHWEPTTFVPIRDDKSTSKWLKNEIATVTAESHDRIFAVNARTTSMMMVEFAKRHIASKATDGRIINISTDAAYCFPSEATYGASKLALESYSRTAAHELGQYGITVNIVSPGPIQTGYITAEMEEEIKKNTPLGRVGSPDDVADVVVFLASQQACWLTGQKLYVGGGHRM
jgi:3-oxoacyl-[acyl-carrier protein] reductase